MRPASYNRLQRLRADLSCPHCGKQLSSPPARKLTQEEIDKEIDELVDLFNRERCDEARRTDPTDRSFGQWVCASEVPNDATGTALLEGLIRLTDQVADVVGPRT